MKIFLLSMNSVLKRKLLFILLLLVQAGLHAQVDFTDSNLPIVIIDTDIDPETGEPMVIPDDPKIWADMKIIYRPDGSRNYITDVENPEFLNYDGRIKIELRGSTSQLLPKKPYGWTTYDDEGEKQNVSIMGMPSENDWILNSLAFDATLLRDYLAYNLAREMGQYASRTQYCEVILNGDYIGLYILQEKIKDDSKRVNIEEVAEDAAEGIALTGGYITKADKTTGGDPVAWVMESDAGNTDFIHELPKPEDVTVEQDAYIYSVFTALETAMMADDADIITGFPSIIDVPTFIDFMIMNEFSSNVDAYQISTFFHKDKGGKLRAGPVWDFNLSFGHDEFGERSQPDIWQFDNDDNEGPRFWKQLFANDEFKCYLAKRWNDLTMEGKPLHYDSVDEFIDESVELISEAIIRENERWGTIPNHAAEIVAMKEFISERLEWITENIGVSTGCNDVALPSLVISKIDYNPGISEEFPESDDQEFIEITNTGTQTVDLTGIYLSELGISYQFPADSSIEGGERIFIVSNPDIFEQKYDKIAFGQFQRNLSNGSQKLVLADAFGNSIDIVEYDDDTPWPDADGNGSYLVLTDVGLDNSLASSWTTSNDNSLSVKRVEAAKAVMLYPNPVKGYLTVKSDEFVSKLEVYDLYGKLIYSAVDNSSDITIDFGGYAAGLYIVKVTGNSGTLVQKIVKQ